MAMLFGLGCLAALSLLLTLWQWLAAYRFPLHRRISDKSFTPPITLLKPLKGLDSNTIQCLQSWLRQDYAGPVQILFGVASANDPVCGPLLELLGQHPGANAQLLVCSESLGANAKVSTLIQLLRQAQHEFIVVSDADVFVPADFLLNVVSPLRDKEVGLVNCFYRLANPATLAMRWEALAINADFWSQVLQGRMLAPLDFALGAVMAVRRKSLAASGGFDALANYLADDFQLGNRIVRRAGKQIALCPVVVDCREAPMTWRQAWVHQLRWARTIRVCKPAPYAASIVSNATLWPLLWVVMGPSSAAWLTLAAALPVRIAMAQTLQRRLGAVAGQEWYCWLAPVKDLLQFALWVGAFNGRQILWRGENYRLHRDGRLVPAESLAASAAEPAFAME
jgi:ceramide glucosyltransferase